MVEFPLGSTINPSGGISPNGQYLTSNPAHQPA